MGLLGSSSPRPTVFIRHTFSGMITRPASGCAFHLHEYVTS